MKTRLSIMQFIATLAILLGLTNSAAALEANLTATNVTFTLNDDGSVLVQEDLEWTVSDGDMGAMYFEKPGLKPNFIADKCQVIAPDKSIVPLTITKVETGKWDVVAASRIGVGKATWRIVYKGDAVLSGRLTKVKAPATNAETGETALKDFFHLDYTPATWEFPLEKRTFTLILPVDITATNAKLSNSQKKYWKTQILAEKVVTAANKIDYSAVKTDDGLQLAATFAQTAVAAGSAQQIDIYFPQAALPLDIDSKLVKRSELLARNNNKIAAKRANKRQDKEVDQKQSDNTEKAAAAEPEAAAVQPKDETADNKAAENTPAETEPAAVNGAESSADAENQATSEPQENKEAAPAEEQNPAAPEKAEEVNQDNQPEAIAAAPIETAPETDNNNNVIANDDEDDDDDDDNDDDNDDENLWYTDDADQSAELTAAQMENLEEMGTIENENFTIVFLFTFPIFFILLRIKQKRYGKAILRQQADAELSRYIPGLIKRLCAYAFILCGTLIVPLAYDPELFPDSYPLPELCCLIILLIAAKLLSPKPFGTMSRGSLLRTIIDFILLVCATLIIANDLEIFEKTDLLLLLASYFILCIPLYHTPRPQNNGVAKPATNNQAKK